MGPPRLTLVSDNTREKTDATAAANADGAREAALVAASGDQEEASAAPLSERALREKLRRLEALLFAASQPLDAKELARCLDAGDDVNALLLALQAEYRDRGVTLARVAGR